MVLGSRPSCTDMFSNCRNLISVNKIEGTLQRCTRMFSTCEKLVTIPELDCSNLDSNAAMQDMFDGCRMLSNESLNNILNTCAKSSITNSSYKKLKVIGLTSAQATTCEGLSNYQAFLDAGWTKGY